MGTFVQRKTVISGDFPQNNFNKILKTFYKPLFMKICYNNEVY